MAASDGGWGQLVPDWRKRLDHWQAGILSLSQAYASRGEAMMKNEAPWTDRSANARNRLFGRASVFSATPDNYEIGFTLGHGINYGVFLEQRQQNIRQVTRQGVTGPWTMIVRPTADGLHEEFFKDVEKITSRG